MKIRQLLENSPMNLKRLLLLFQDLLGDHFDDEVEIKTKIANNENIRFDVFFNQDNIKQWNTRYGEDNIDHLEVFGERYNTFYKFRLYTFFSNGKHMQDVCIYVLFTEENNNISLYVSGGILGNGDDSRTYHSWKEAFIGFIDELKYVLKTD